MPFTLSHPAAVVPLRWLRLPIAALAVGSMVPDIPLFLPGWGYGLSHSVTGLLTVDLAVGLLITVAWWTLLRAPFVDALPTRVRTRMPDRPALRPALLLAPIAVVVGGLTHVGWDEFTHEGRWGERHVPWLAADYFGVGGVHWAQGASGLFGLIVVATALWQALRRGAATSRPVRLRGFGICAGSAVVLAAVVTAVVAAATASGGLHGAVLAAVTTAVPAAATCALVAAGAWWVGARSWSGRGDRAG